MNVLHNFHKFYEVYADSESDLSGPEEKRRELAQRCYEVNLKYVQEQLALMKKLIHDSNLPLYQELAAQVDSILKKLLL